MGVASAHAGSTHEHTQTGRSAFSPQFLSSGCPALQNPRHRSVRGPTRVNALFTSCLLASNFHLRDWPAQLEHRPQAAAGRERLYCLVLYLSLAGLEKCCPSLRRQQPPYRRRRRRIEHSLLSVTSAGFGRTQAGRLMTRSGAVASKAWAVFRFAGDCLKWPERQEHVQQQQQQPRRLLCCELARGALDSLRGAERHVAATVWDKLAFFTWAEARSNTASDHPFPLTAAMISKRAQKKKKATSPMK